MTKELLERNQAIADRYASNPELSLADLGKEYGLSRERIRQIVEKIYPGLPKTRYLHAVLEKEVWDLAQTAHYLAEIAKAVGILPQTLYRWAMCYPEYEGLSEKVRENRRRHKAEKTHNTCKTCKETKPIVEFQSRRNICKSCNALRAQEWWAKADFDVSVEEKTCPACLRTLSADNFYKSRGHKDGLQTYCKECTNRLNRGEAVKEIRKSWGHSYSGKQRFN